MTRKQLKTGAIAAAVLLALIVALQNTDSVATKILFMQVEMPRAMLLFVNLGIGFLIGLIVGTRVRRQGQSEARA